MDKHSPTPWKDAVYYSTNSVRIYSESNTDIADVTGSDGKGQANAAYIVRCVNLHEELKDFVDWLATERNPNIYEAIDRAMKLRQAIAKAEGR